MRTLRRWIFRVLVASDVWLNTILGGDADMTVSLRTARAAKAGRWWGRAGCRVLDLLSPGHCQAQFQTDEGREVT